MFNTRKFATELAYRSNKLYMINEQDMLRLKKCLLEMYEDIFKVCEKYNLKIMLGGGSALGAIRHGGFIPWDDDLDLLMPRLDYNKFVKLFDKELSEKYEITSPNSKYDVSNAFTKIYRKNTKLVEMFNINSDTPKGVFIDIFPIEYVSQNKVARGIKGILANIIYYVATSVSMYQLRNEVTDEYFSASRGGKTNYILRKVIGFCGAFIDYKKWFNFYDKYFVQGKPSSMCGIPSGRKHYFGEILSERVFFPPTEILFEDRKAYVPNDSNKYLRNLYGDYMKIPPVEKRERHYFIELKLEE